MKTNTARVTPGRNEPCSCGSGRKYKKCCAQQTGSIAVEPATTTTAKIDRLFALINAGHFAEAEVAARVVLPEAPNSGLVWKVLGMALAMQGKDALAALKKTAALLPEDAEAHSNLGNALQDAGDLEGAVRSHRRAIALEPRFAEAHNNLGSALRSCGRLEEAVASYRRAIDLKPDYSMAYSNLGSALRDLGSLAAATGCYERSLAMQPGSAEIHRNLGAALRLQNRSAEAEMHARAALEINPNYAPALVSLAKLRADVGEFEEAETLYRRAISLEPKSPEAWSGIPALRRMTPADAAWLESATRLASEALTPRHEVPLRFAIGKYHDDVRQFDAAFESYRRANELSKRYRPAYEPRRQADAVERICRAYDRPWMTRAREALDPSARPILVVGMPRSGTTLAEQILAAHPAVFGAGELGFWSIAAETRGPFAPGDTASDQRLGAAASDYLRLLETLGSGALRVVDKMPMNFLHLGLIHAALPGARIIHMRRNPIDTCLSIYFQDFEAALPYANDLGNLVHFHAQYLRLMDHWRRLLPADVLLEVPYEGLVDEQETWSRRMVEFVGLAWDPRCLEFHAAERSVSTASNWQVRQKMNRRSVERWRNYAESITALLPLLQPLGADR